MNDLCASVIELLTSCIGDADVNFEVVVAMDLDVALDSSCNPGCQRRVIISSVRGIFLVPEASELPIDKLAVIVLEGPVAERLLIEEWLSWSGLVMLKFFDAFSACRVEKWTNSAFIGWWCS